MAHYGWCPNMACPCWKECKPCTNYHGEWDENILINHCAQCGWEEKDHPNMHIPYLDN